MRFEEKDTPIRLASLFFLILAIAIVGRLFMLQILQHDYYATFAMDTHEIYERLHPKRGDIYFSDSRTGQTYPAATTKEYYAIYAVPKEIPADQIVSTTAAVATVLNFNDQDKIKLQEKLSKNNDPYESIARKMDENIKDQISALNLKGIYAIGESYRYYPEGNLAAPVLGFLGSDADGNLVGRYGVEGYWNKELSGQGGILIGEKSAQGSLIALADKKMVSPENGADLVLTIDRSLQYKLCERLRDGLKTYGAKSAALVMMDPNTGAILANCSLPDFDPNNYSKVESASVYTNSAIFTAYEPGSVFKAITMASGLDLGLVSPNTTFTDPCMRKFDTYEIRNALDKCYGTQTMTGVLENSINTGVIWVEEKMGSPTFLNYVEKFGFGKKTGVALSSESAGDVTALEKKGQIFGAVGSFGQGITATPLQLAVAYSALANGGNLLKPYIVQEIRYPDGKVVKTQPKITEEVISQRTSKLISGMLASVVDHGQAKYGAVPGYFVAGKTGTAQIAGKGGYSKDDTNHTFAGFAPADNPKFVLIVRYEKPQRAWADSTAAPTFADIAKFALEYYNIPKER